MSTESERRLHNLQNGVHLLFYLQYMEVKTHNYGKHFVLLFGRLVLAVVIMAIVLNPK